MVVWFWLWIYLVIRFIVRLGYKLLDGRSGYNILNEVDWNGLNLR